VAERLPTWLSDIDPVDGLISLTDKSLLRQSDTEGEEPRFEMLESVREYAVERLEADAELMREARSAHAAYYASWAAERGTEVRGPDRATALQELFGKKQGDAEVRLRLEKPRDFSVILDVQARVRPDKEFCAEVERICGPQAVEVLAD
jgi:hypothetical protein